MDIAVTGSIAYDYLMRFPGKFAEHIIPEKIDILSVSFLVDEMTRQWGGVAANITFTLALLNLTPRPKLVGTVGQDFGPYREWLESTGVDTSTVRQIDSVFTASFFVNTDTTNSQIAFFYAGAMAFAKTFALKALLPNSPDLVVISPNDPAAMQQYVDECHAEGHKFLYDPSQQTARLNGEELLHGIERCYILAGNDYEYEVIAKKTGWTIDQIIDRVPVSVITRGENGADIYAEGQQVHIPAFPPSHIADPTGVGDAFRSGLLRGIAAGLPWDVCGKMGSVAASYVLENVGTQNHKFTIAEFTERFRAHFDDDGALDTLLE